MIWYFHAPVVVSLCELMRHRQEIASVAAAEDSRRSLLGILFELLLNLLDGSRSKIAGHPEHEGVIAGLEIDVHVLR